MKSPEELTVLKVESETANNKLPALSDEDLEQVTGGFVDIEITLDQKS